MKRMFRLEITGIVEDLDDDLSDENLRLNLEYIVQNASGNGMFTGESSAMVETWDYTVEVAVSGEEV